MSEYSRQVLTLDLGERRASYSSFAELGHLLGGLGIGLELVRQHQDAGPTVFSIGPLNGFFPFASKACVLSLAPGKLYESYISGKFSLILRFAGIDALIVKGISAQPLFVSIYPGGLVDFFESSESELFSRSGIFGRRSVLYFTGEESLADGRFRIDTEIGRRLFLANIRGLVVSGDASIPLYRGKEYMELYQEILSKGHLLDVPYDGDPSCGGCPAGCVFSKLEEQKHELVLSHCLVTCGFASKIYENIPFIFSCLNSLGLPYKHEDLEALPERIGFIRGHL